MRSRPHHLILAAVAAAILSTVALAGCGSDGPSATPTPTARVLPTGAVPTSAAPTSAAPTDVAPTLPPTLPPVPATTPPEVTLPLGLQASDWIGVWRGQEVNEFGVAQSETVLMSDGSFANQTSNPQFGSLVTSWGTWQIVAAADPFLRFDIDGHEPTEFCGPVTCTPVLMPAGVSQLFVFLDRDTVDLWTSDCASATCRVTYTRAR
jgi:predicted small lipoprotein YifL